ncbi:MAG: tetratricopeptide repeat protein [Rikenellaceae bacterium]
MKHILILISLLSLSLWAVAEEVDSLAQSSVEVEVEVEVEEQSIIAPDSLWDSANTAYINAQYSDAVELYTAIVDQGLISEKLFFNLGNAYYKNDNIAKAILYYQKGLLISPNSKDILYNLAIAQSQTKDQIEEIPELFFHRWNRSIARMLDCTGWSIISLIALSLLLAGLLLFLLGGAIPLRKTGFRIGLFAAIIFTVTTLYALGERREIIEHNSAVIMSRSISIKSSPDRSATDLFMLHSGTTVKILREMDDWYEIMIADGKEGWIESKRVEKI